MKVTAILNLKGGVAKTTTAINLAAVLARFYGKRVLLIDADSQCNTTEFCGIDPGRVVVSLVDVLRQSKSANPEFVICKTNIPGVDLIPAADELMGFDITALKYGTGKPEAIREFLGLVRDRYDFCLIDCPPAFSASGFAALVAAHDVLIPIKLDAFSLRGMGNLMQQVENMRRLNSRLEVVGLLPTMFYKSERTDEARKVLANSPYRVFPAIRQSRRVDEMTYRQEPLCVCSPTSAAAVDYRRFSEKYLEVEK